MINISKSILDGFIKVNNEQDLRVRQIHLYIEGYKPVYHEFMRSHRENLFSASKVYTSIAIGMAIDEGIININDYVIDIFPEFMPFADEMIKKVI